MPAAVDVTLRKSDLARTPRGRTGRKTVRTEGKQQSAVTRNDGSALHAGHSGRTCGDIPARTCRTGRSRPGPRAKEEAPGEG